MYEISVIVACYNSEKYIHRCINALLAQTLASGIQIIAIDDGSQDKTLSILREYEEKHAHVKVLANEFNCGSGATKNRGVSAAEGRYIGFCDSDDYVDANYYEGLLNAAISFDADMACSGIVLEEKGVKTYHRLEENNLYRLAQGDNKENKDDEPYLVDAEMVFGHWSISSACTKLFKREIAKKYQFHEGVCDDIPAIPPAVAYAKKIVFCPTLYYHYIIRTGSLEHSGFSEHRLFIADRFLETADIIETDTMNTRCVYLLFLQVILPTINNICAIPSFSEKMNYLRKFRERLGDKAISFWDVCKNDYINIYLNRFTGQAAFYYYTLYALFFGSDFEGLERHLLDWGLKSEKYTPKVSVVIPVYNGSDYLRDAIDSVLRQTYKNIEIIVVNDGSSDDGATEAIALSYGEKIRYFYKENGGVATALNLGIEKMSGDYFSWLSHDDFYEKEKIECQIEALRIKTDYSAVVYCGYTVTNAAGEPHHEMLPSSMYNKEWLQVPLFPVFRGLLNGCCLLIHRQSFAKGGRFATDLRTTQDYDMWFRLLREEHVLYVDRSLVFSRTHAEQGSVQEKGHEEECSKLWIRLMDDLTDSEKIDFEGSVYQFYMNTHNFLYTHTPYHKASSYALEKMQEHEADECKEKRNDLRDQFDVTRNDVSNEVAVIRQKPIIRLKQSFQEIGLLQTVRKAFRWALKRVIRCVKEWHHKLVYTNRVKRDCEE
ncbi:glycosyltransferase family 2 protein [Ruminococcaceae bacterium OttesenSCG-928-L11]|nr:glycosyltransferase family 2 protein [Ruminococcaceae bacterium OttesenSCG-928-L11]